MISTIAKSFLLKYTGKLAALGAKAQWKASVAPMVRGLECSREVGWEDGCTVRRVTKVARR